MRIGYRMLLIATGVGAVSGAVWRRWHLNEREKVARFYRAYEAEEAALAKNPEARAAIAAKFQAELEAKGKAT